MNGMTEDDILELCRAAEHYKSALESAEYDISHLQERISALESLQGDDRRHEDRSRSNATPIVVEASIFIYYCALHINVIYIYIYYYDVIFIYLHNVLEAAVMQPAPFVLVITVTLTCITSQELEESLLQLDSELSNMKLLLDEKSRECDDLQAAKDDLAEALSVRLERSDELQQQVGDLRAEVMRLRDENNRQAVQLQQSEGRVLEFEGVVSELQSRAEALLAGQVALQAENTRLRHDLDKCAQKAVSVSDSTAAEPLSPPLQPRRHTSYCLSEWEQTYGMQRTSSPGEWGGRMEKTRRRRPRQEGGGEEGRRGSRLLLALESKHWDSGGRQQEQVSQASTGGSSARSAMSLSASEERLRSPSGEQGGEGTESEGEGSSVPTDWREREQTHPYYPHPPHASSLWQSAACGVQEVSTVSMPMCISHLCVHDCLPLTDCFSTLCCSSDSTIPLTACSHSLQLPPVTPWTP